MSFAKKWAIWNLFLILGLLSMDAFAIPDFQSPLGSMPPPPIPREHEFGLAPMPQKRFEYLRQLFRSFMDVEDDIRAHRVLNALKTTERSLNVVVPEVFLFHPVHV